MVPRSILHGLASLRWRERFLQLAWGGARVFALLVGLLLIGAFIDWFVDREQDTPWALRGLIAGIQALVLVSATVFFLVLALARRLPNDELALRVERQHPELDQRLISAVQLNQAGADTEGMSPALIAHVTREAEKQASQIPFARVADHRRLTWSALFVAPALALIAAPMLLWPEVWSTLLARQFLADLDIPRSITFGPLADKVVPQGDKVQLKFTVFGANLSSDLIGEVRVQPVGQPQDRYELILDEKSPVKDGEATYVAQLPASSTDLTYRARLLDGRSQSARVKFVPLPVIDHAGWVQLPAFCGLRPNGQRYEQPQPSGEIKGIPGSAARVAAVIQKPVTKATLILLQEKTSDGPIKHDHILEHLPMILDSMGTQAEVIFDLRPDATAYEIEVADEYGFVNKPRSRRSLRVIPEEPPQVWLLKEQFPPALFDLLGSVDGGLDDSVVEGLPVLLGGKIRIPYEASGRYGLGQARILYRVLIKAESGNDVVKEVPFTVLPLGEVKGSDKTGPFQLKYGHFANSPFLESIPFHALPSDNPDVQLGRIQGGGRYDLDTNGLVDHQGKPLAARLGDQIEYCVEVFSKNPDPKRKPARSETRVKTIVSLLELTRWMEDITREEQAINSLDKKQRGLFDK